MITSVYTCGRCGRELELTPSGRSVFCSCLTGGLLPDRHQRPTFDVMERAAAAAAEGRTER